MRKSLTLLIALGMLVSPEAAGAFPIESPAAVHALPGIVVPQGINGPQLGAPVVQVEYRRSVRRRTVVRRGPAGRTVVRHSTVRRTTVVRPVRPWVRRPYYGRVVAGVALGTVVAVAATTAPRPPASNLCWYWSNSSRTRGYWDYCR